MDLTRVETHDAPPVVQFGYTGADTGFFDVPSTSSPGPELTGGVTNREFESVFEFRRVSPIAEALERLRQIKGVGPNWDSYGSEAPTHAAVARAHSLIWEVYMGSVNAGQRPAVPYSVVPLSGGGVQVEWRGDAAAIEVERIHAEDRIEVIFCKRQFLRRIQMQRDDAIAITALREFLIEECS